MNNNYLITIRGIQNLDGEVEEIEVITVGEYHCKNDKKYIIYKEYIENEEKPKTTIVKYEDENKVYVINPNQGESKLILERGKRHLCHYNTLAGNIMVGVTTHEIYSTLTDDGGTIQVEYTLDMNAETVSENQFKIEVKKN